MNGHQSRSAETSEDDDGQKIQAAIEDLLSRARTLLSEIEALRRRLQELRYIGNVEVAHIRSIVTSELARLERLSAAPPTDASAHVLRSSNMPFLEHLWAIAKRSENVMALEKRVYFKGDSIGTASPCLTSGTFGRGRACRKNNKHGVDSAIIDLISDKGRVWTKMSLANNNRILYDLAKLGWVSDSEEDEDLRARATADDDDENDIPLVKTCKQLVKASENVRVYTKHPVLYLALPRIKLGVTPQVDHIIQKCRSLGIIVSCSEDLNSTPPLDQALRKMAPDPIESFSDVVNVDCTVLLALVSDFSHASVTKKPWFHQALQRQVEIEDNENLLPSMLYPAMGNRNLVCTAEAAKRMREIVDVIGTPSEKARTALMMGDGETKSRTELLDELQKWSAYPVPDEWAIPIKVVDKDEDKCMSRLSSEALAAGADMTPINFSVFMHGWATGRTTVTSNRVAVKQIYKKLEEQDDLDDSAWPKIWLCPTSRSLVGKEKRGAKKEEKAEGARPLPDPLRREHQRRNGLDVLSLREGKEVEDLRPNGYPSEDVLAAKMAAQTMGQATASEESADTDFEAEPQT